MKAILRIGRLGVVATNAFLSVAPVRRKRGRSHALRFEPLEHRALLAADTLFPLDKIVALDADRGDHFGESVAMTDDGVLAVVGARYDDQGGRNAGAAYLLRYDEILGSWTQVQKLMSNSPQNHEEMGSSAAITGTVEDATVVVGTGSNIVYVFDCRQITDQIECDAPEPLTAPSATDSFSGGNAVAISRHANGETLVVGDPEASNGPSAGTAFVFERSIAGQWPDPVTLISPTAGSGMGTSAAVSQDGTTIAVGAARADEVHVFVRTDTTNPFSQAEYQATITASTTTSGPDDFFLGYDVDLSPSGDLLVVSAMWETFVTTREGPDWESHTLEPADRLDPGQQDLSRFGWAVDVSGSGDEIAVGTTEAKAFVFSSDATCAAPVHGLCLSRNLVHDDPGGGNLESVATDGSTVLVGNRRNDVGSTRDAGAVHVFDLDAVALPTLTIESISPPTMPVNETISVTVMGAGFEPGATLTFSGSRSPQASDVVVVDSSTITAMVSSHKKFGGEYTVIVTNPSGSLAELQNGFTVTTSVSSSVTSTSVAVHNAAGGGALGTTSKDAVVSDSGDSWQTSQSTIGTAVSDSEGETNVRRDPAIGEESLDDVLGDYEVLLVDDELLEVLAGG